MLCNGMGILPLQLRSVTQCAAGRAAAHGGTSVSVRHSDFEVAFVIAVDEVVLVCI